MQSKPVAKVFLKPEREKSLLRHHPWVFSGALSENGSDIKTGSLVTVCTAGGQALGVGVFNSRSDIRVRILSWDVSQSIDYDFWLSRVRSARALRMDVISQDGRTNCYRLIHSDADRVPGLIVDVFGDWVVVQFLAVACEVYEEQIVKALTETLQPRGIYLRNDAEGREKEGQEVRVGRLWGDEPPAEIEVKENEFSFLVDIRNGQKTGFYLDQRDNREALRSFAGGKDLLNAFCFSGAFSVYAAGAGAQSIVNLDSSADSLELCRKNIERNSPAFTESEYCLGDAFESLRQFRDRARQFDVIVLDPPKFAFSRSHVEKAARAYKDINLLALKLLRPGGILFTFSCSGSISLDLFQKIVFGAAVDAKTEVQAIRYLHQSSDHPVLLSVPESEYLKGLICRKL